MDAFFDSLPKKRSMDTWRAHRLSCESRKVIHNLGVTIIVYLGKITPIHGMKSNQAEIMEILAFFNGILFFYTHDITACIVLAIAYYLGSSKNIILWFLVAFCWAWGHNVMIAERGVPRLSLISPAQVYGKIISIPHLDENKAQFHFKIYRLNHRLVQSSALLSCYQHCPVFKAGEFWTFAAKLKRPANLGNPGALNTRNKLVANHLFWVGSIQGTTAVRVSETQKWISVLAWREKIAGQLNDVIHDPVVSGIAQALTLGISQQITPDQWQLFRQTGTTHLMVISGAHIGLVGGFFFFLGDWLWRRSSRLCLWAPAQQAASVLAIVAALVYAVLAGFAIPAERAVIASGLLFSRYFLQYRFSGWQAWRYALLFVLLNEPHAVLLPGFYLSFMAVAILIAMSQRCLSEGIQKIIFLQLACLFGLMPMSLYWFSYSAMNGFFANLIAIPLIGYVMVPLSLVTLCVGFFTDHLSILSATLDFFTHGLLDFLRWVDGFSWMNVSLPVHDALSMIGLLLVFILGVALPIRMIWPALGVILLSCYLPYYQRPQVGEAYIDVLDVGQGLSVLVETLHHQLLYDTGMAFYTGGDMGELAILPYLSFKGIHHLDAIVISHPDLDHRGGLASIEKALSVDQLLVNDVSFYHRGQNCHLYPDWSWDGVRFHFISLYGPGLNSRNNNSCVLQVTTDVGSVLLPGDIERQAENYLVKNNPKALAASILVVAHHGSKTSSTPDFVRQVNPHYAVISAGFDNRFHFPHPQTLTTFARESIPVFNTMDCGMVHIELPQKGHLPIPECFLNKQSDYNYFKL